MTSETFDKPAAPLARLLADRPLILRVGVVLLGSWLVAASSWAEIPMVPVPMTVQTYAVLAIAGLAGGRMALEIVIVWLAQAAMGLPVLAGGASGIEALGGNDADADHCRQYGEDRILDDEGEAVADSPVLRLPVP